MKYIRLAMAALMLIAVFIGCEDEKNIPQVSAKKHLTGGTEKVWEIESFKEDGMEKLNVLEQDTCYQSSFRFRDDDNQTFSGNGNTVDCIVYGIWYLESANTKLGLSISIMDDIGLGPWSGPSYNVWKIVKLSDDALKIEIDYQNKTYLISFKKH